MNYYLKKSGSYQFLSVPIGSYSLFFLLLSLSLHAAPNEIVYNGRLLDSTGNVVDTASVQVNFILYTAAAAGTAVYEDRNAAVSVSGGLYKCTIGDDTTNYGRVTTNFETALSTATHLEISIGGSTMSPREPLKSAPFSVNSNFAPFTVTMFAEDTQPWSNMPAAPTEFLGVVAMRTQLDLTGASAVRLTVVMRVAGTATAKLRAQYSTDQVNWYYFDGVTGPSVNVNAVGLQVSGWVNLANAAKQDVYIRLVGLDGNGATDPRFALITLQFR